MKNKNSGMTLIEVLIALLVLSIGILGAARLQLASLQSTQEAQFRTIASVAAESLAERMVADGALRVVDRDAVLDSLAGVLPDPEVETEVLDDPLTGAESIAVDLTWQARGGERSVRHITALEATP